MKKIWLIGAGPMAQDYIKVLEELDTEYTVIGRGEGSAAACRKLSSKEVVTGGLENYLTSSPALVEYAIVAVPVEELATCCTALMEYGVKHILVEKPAGVDATEIHTLNEQSKALNVNLLLAYNRRFYASTLMAEKMIQEDGGVTSTHFEFTEWSHVIETLKKPEAIFQKWFLGNSTHVVDLAFYLAGAPEELSAYTKGSLSWHESASVFVGAGTTNKGALFSYHANWEAPGRWQVEVLTKKHRYVFKPMEELRIIKIGSVKEESVDIDYTLDKDFKPGLYKQTEAFLANDFSKHCNIEEQNTKIDFYYKMANYI